MAETHTVGSGKTYATFAAAESAQNGDLSGRGVVGFEGTGGDLGTLVVAGGTNVDASNYIRIYAAAGSEHNGKITADDGCYVDVTGYANAIDVQQDYTRLEGIRIQVDAVSEWGGGVAIDWSSWAGALIDSVVIVLSDVANATYESIKFTDTAVPVGSPTIRNCLVYYTGSVFQLHDGIVITWAYAGGSDDNGTIYVYNNSVYNAASGLAPRAIQSGAGIPTLNIVSTNNIVIDSASADYVDNSSGGGVLGMTQTYCIASDLTADDWGGAGNLNSKTGGGSWVATGNDHTLKGTGADCYNAGTTIGSFSDDAIGTSRPQGAAWDIGAMELAVAAGFPHSFGVVIG